jgi:SNF2 family DNA or RNA helicase
VIDLQLERWKIKPYAHQVEGVKLLLENPYFGLFDEMGVGKSAQVINAACLLRDELKVDVVMVISPAAVRSVWINPDFGEVKKHCWLPARVFEFHSKTRRVWQDKDPRLEFVVTNYEYLRSEEHLEELKTLLHGRQVMLVLDEASFIKNRQAVQTKACVALGKLAARRVILNGTPIGNNPFDLWSQANFLSPGILPYKNFFHFRAEYSTMGGWHNKQVIAWRNLDKLQDLMGPHVIRREKKDCLDLPDKIKTQVEVPLSEATWKIYKQMKDDAVVWLEENPSLAAQAGVRVMRLSQITSGYLGGFITDESPEVIDGHELSGQTREIGREKLEFLRGWVTERLAERPDIKIIVWCRFRPELERVARELAEIRISPTHTLDTYRLYGQGKKERDEAIARFSDVKNTRPALLAGQVQAGGFGLNLVAADHVVYLSNTFSLLSRLQSEDRVHRPGQVNHVLYLDVLATGPKGQKTVDHAVFTALHKKEDMANWTVSAWKRALEEE